MNVVVTHTFSCSSCDSVASTSFRMNLPAEPVRPSLPLGWIDVADRVYCDRHIVSIFVDGNPEVDLT